MDKLRKESGSSTSNEYTSAKISYKIKRDKNFEELNEIINTIELIKTNFEKIEKEKEERDNKCLKIHK